MAHINVIFFGDVVGRIGRRALSKIVPEFKKKYKPDFVIANGENLAHGSGITEKTMDEVLNAGIDLITTGNHVWKKPGAEELLDAKDAQIIRPANYPSGTAGEGWKIVEKNKQKLIVINLMGRVFFREHFSSHILALKTSQQCLPNASCL